jgi:hypothetical protein
VARPLQQKEFQAGKKEGRKVALQKQQTTVNRRKILRFISLNARSQAEGSHPNRYGI